MFKSFLNTSDVANEVSQSSWPIQMSLFLPNSKEPAIEMHLDET